MINGDFSPWLTPNEPFQPVPQQAKKNESVRKQLTEYEETFYKEIFRDPPGDIKAPETSNKQKLLPSWNQKQATGEEIVIKISSENSPIHLIGAIAEGWRYCYNHSIKQMKAKEGLFLLQSTLILLLRLPIFWYQRKDQIQGCLLSAIY